MPHDRVERAAGGRDRRRVRSGLQPRPTWSSAALPSRVYEAGGTVGANLRDWGHVRIFTTWEQSIDPVSAPVAGDARLVDPADQCLADRRRSRRSLSHAVEPACPGLADAIETDAQDHALSRQGHRQGGQPRTARPSRSPCGSASSRRFGRVDLARGVIDASGTWHNPNPLGATGLPALGEAAVTRPIAPMACPISLATSGDRYADKRVAVVGAGYSAINVLLDLTRLDGKPGALYLGRPRQEHGQDLRRRRCRRTAPRGQARPASAEVLVDTGRVRLVTGVRDGSRCPPTAAIIVLSA